MNTSTVIALAAAIYLLPCAGLLLFSALLERSYDRRMRREHDKFIHPSNVERNVRILHLTIDDFNGCGACLVGKHNRLPLDGRCKCCGMLLPNSYNGGE